MLYNDGGFDLSQDGKVLAACAEYWLPNGVNNAMELLQSQQHIDDERENSIDGDGECRAKSPAAGGVTIELPSPSPMQQTFPLDADPRTPPPSNNFTSLEPPSPPGKRNIPRCYNANAQIRTVGSVAGNRQTAMARLLGLPTPHHPHPLSVVAASHPAYQAGGGRYVPHIVTVSMDTSSPFGIEATKQNPGIPAADGTKRNPKLGQLIVAAPLDGAKASGVTCVKLSPSAEYCLLGYGVRESIPSVDGREESRHPVTALYNVKKGMKHVCTLTSVDDDVNIARFHPESGHGFVYGTKQGRVRVLSTRPWNEYHL